MRMSLLAGHCRVLSTRRWTVFTTGFVCRFRLEALESLASDLEDKGSKLFVFKGSASHVLEQLLNDLREGLSDVGLYFHQELGPDAEAAERAAVSAFQATAAGLGRYFTGLRLFKRTGCCAVSSSWWPCQRCFSLNML